MKFISLLTILAFGSFGLHSQNCDDLFISAYLEGASDDKAIEIYNPTASSISLDNYKIRRYTNGSSSPTTIAFTSGATIAANDVYVVANSKGATGLLAVADQTTGSMQHNGDDAIALYNGTSNIDVIGVIGVDPGTNWTVGSGSTKDHLLKRKSSVLTGVTSWNTSQWDVYDDETWSSLGSQTCDCYTNTRDFSANAYTYTNGGGVTQVLERNWTLCEYRGIPIRRFSFLISFVQMKQILLLVETLQDLSK